MASKRDPHRLSKSTTTGRSSSRAISNVSSRASASSPGSEPCDKLRGVGRYRKTAIDFAARGDFYVFIEYDLAIGTNGKGAFAVGCPQVVDTYRTVMQCCLAATRVSP